MILLIQRMKRFKSWRRFDDYLDYISSYCLIILSERKLRRKRLISRFWFKSVYPNSFKVIVLRIHSRTNLFMSERSWFDSFLSHRSILSTQTWNFILILLSTQPCVPCLVDPNLLMIVWRRMKMKRELLWDCMICLCWWYEYCWILGKMWLNISSMWCRWLITLLMKKWNVW